MATRFLSDSRSGCPNRDGGPSPDTVGGGVSAAWAAELFFVLATGTPGRVSASDGPRSRIWGSHLGFSDWAVAQLKFCPVGSLRMSHVCTYRHNSFHLHLQPVLLDDGSEFRCLRPHEFRELLWGAVVGACAHRGDVLGDVVALPPRFALPVECIGPLRRGRLWEEHAKPGGDVELGKLRRAFAHGR